MSIEELLKIEVMKATDIGYKLFYNSTGSTTAYKLCIRHISAAPAFGYGKEKFGILKPSKDIYIIDIDTGQVFKTKNSIKVINLDD